MKAIRTEPSAKFRHLRLPSDYRLSEMNTYMYGGTLQIRVAEMATLNLGYKRYHMVGTDGVTPESAFTRPPTYSIGFTVWF